MNSSFTHRIIAFLLTIVLFLSLIKDTSILIDFAINQDMIAKTLCVQKDNQQGCFGKCQLVKALKKDMNNAEMPIQSNQNNIVYNYIQPVNEYKLFTFIVFQPKKCIDTKNYNVINKYYKIALPPPLFS